MNEVAAPGPMSDDDARSRARRRATLLLVTSAGLGSIGYIAAFTVMSLAARELLHDATLAGASTTAVIIGSAVGASLLARSMVGRGRRFGLVLGFAIAVVGGLLLAVAIVRASFWLLLVGSFLFGFGNSSMQLSRYAAADMAQAHRRAWAISLVVWAATAGAILGPNLAPLAADLVEEAGVVAMAGPFLVGALFLGLAGLLLFVLLRPDPYELAQRSSTIAEGETGEPMRRILRRPVVGIAVMAMVVGQVVMVGIMTMTPVHMGDHGHGLGAVGLVISVHTAGMFAFAPIVGRVAGTLGNVTSILLGAAVLAAAGILAAVAPPEGGVILLLALFLLGLGWNFGFVAGSALLMSGVHHAERTRAEGFADTLTWGSSAAASLGSGFVLALVGYAWLGILGALLLLLPVAAILRLRRDVAAVAAASS